MNLAPSKLENFGFEIRCSKFTEKCGNGTPKYKLQTDIDCGGRMLSFEPKIYKWSNFKKILLKLFSPLKCVNNYRFCAELNDNLLGHVEKKPKLR